MSKPSKHGVVASKNYPGHLECACGWPPTWINGGIDLKREDEDITAHIRYVERAQQAVTGYLAKKRATTFLKEVDTNV